jgi:hypothetical protein
LEKKKLTVPGALRDVSDVALKQPSLSSVVFRTRAVVTLRHCNTSGTSNSGGMLANSLIPHTLVLPHPLQHLQLAAGNNIP